MLNQNKMTNVRCFGKWEIQHKLLNAIRSIYKCTRNAIKTNSNMSGEFITKIEMRQSGVLSLLLFTVVMDGM